MSTIAAEPIVTSEMKGRVKWVRFNRPDVKNAITPETADLAREEIRRAEEEGARVVVLGGTGGAFCSGADLKAVGARMGQQISVTDILKNHYHPLVLTIANLPLPVIAAVDGASAGIGCDIALACDMRLVSDRAIFAEIFVNINLMPDGGGTYTLARLVGSGRALEMVMTGTRVSAEDAVKWGLANHLYPTGDFEAKVQEFADALSQKAPMSIAASKKAIRACLSGRSFEDALDNEAREQQALIESEDFREGVAAFLSKRPPKFQGK